MNYIREKRLERGLSATEVAKAIGVTKDAVYAWELNRYQPSGAALAKLMAFFQCSAEELGFAPEAVFQERHSNPRKKLSAEESARREAIKEKVKPYIERRVALGLSVKDLAKKMGWAPSKIREYERGIYWPQWGTRQKLRQVLGMPEERCYTDAERNALLLEMEDRIHWLVRNNARRLSDGCLDADDLYQDLMVCALRAIDRFRPDGGATLKTYVIKCMEFQMKKDMLSAYRHGLSGKFSYPLPCITVLSLEALMEDGLQL